MYTYGLPGNFREHLIVPEPELARTAEGRLREPGPEPDNLDVGGDLGYRGDLAGDAARELDE